MMRMGKKHVDPALDALFTSSFGPIRAPSRARYQAAPPPPSKSATEIQSPDGQLGGAGISEELSSVEADAEDGNNEMLSQEELRLDEASEQESQDLSEEGYGKQSRLDQIAEAAISNPPKKRKRKDRIEVLEDKYMDKLASEDAKEQAGYQADRKAKRQRLQDEQVEPINTSESEHQDDAASLISDSGVDESIPPTHETMKMGQRAPSIEASHCTVFFSNISIAAITSKPLKHTLITHVTSFLSALASTKSKVASSEHRLLSFRFRSTPYSPAIPKRASFARKEIMEATTKSTNAYAVYSTPLAAREAVKGLNGTIVLDRHLRADSVAHPAKIDHKKCVFVGNLGFVDDESGIREDDQEGQRKRGKRAADTEEGLWRIFGKCGRVVNVRVVRDELTRVGKGFGYVEFEDSNAVEAALLLNEKKFPPMLPRVLRVMRSKARQKSYGSRTSNMTSISGTKQSQAVYNPRPDPQSLTLQGRASKLFGRGGAAKLDRSASSGANTTVLGPGREKFNQEARRQRHGIRNPETFIFEGQRASAANGKSRVLKSKRSKTNKRNAGGKQSGRPKSRSARRGAAWKESSSK